MAPTVLGTVLPIGATTAPAIAAGAAKSQDGKFCIEAHARLICVKPSQVTGNAPRAELVARAEAEAKNPDKFVNFTNEESDGAIALFGCDCPACIRSLRQLRIMAQVS
jgi:hypothetical protein